MNAGKIETSKRLQKTLAVLQGGPKTTAEIARETGSQCVHSDIAALRCGGLSIPKAEYSGTTETGSKVYTYRLENAEKWRLV